MAPLTIVCPRSISTGFTGGIYAQGIRIRQEKTHEAPKIQEAQERQEVMSLNIDVDDVVKVNISGTWHDVYQYNEGVSSFFLDAYEFIYDSILLYGGGQEGVCATGFTFVDDDTNLKISGPLTSITAVMYNDPEENDYRVTLLEKQKVD